MSDRLDRRGFLLVTAGLLLSGCTSTADGGSRPPGSPLAGPRSSAPRSPASRPGGASPSLPAVTPWQPSRGDLDPRAKLAAVRLIEARENRDGSALQVLDAQYGGLLTDSASVLVVTRRWSTRPGGPVVSDGATFDVRLARSGRRWRVRAVHPSRPGPPARRLSRAAREVLRSSRIDLPPASRADVLSGQVHPSVLAAMLTLSRSYRIGVSVVRSGHPTYVFGTDRLSDHPRGRAFDTWRVDGRMVVDPGTPRRLVTGFMEAAAAAGSYNVGGPYLLGSAPQFFSDRTHHDHVHAGFSR